MPGDGNDGDTIGGCRSGVPLAWKNRGWLRSSPVDDPTADDALFATGGIALPLAYMNVDALFCSTGRCFGGGAADRASLA